MEPENPRGSAGHQATSDFSNDGDYSPASSRGRSILHFTPVKTEPGLPQSFPRFTPSHSMANVETVAQGVIKLMLKRLYSKTETRGLDDGFIYIFRIPDRPGFVKIGRTTSMIEDRQKQIMTTCKTYTLETVGTECFISVPWHKRVEGLIHRQLHNERRCFSCTCQVRVKKHDSKHECGATKHGEWFEIGEQQAMEVVQSWRRWMRSKPYFDGGLQREWEQRLRDCSEMQQIHDLTSGKSSNGDRWARLHDGSLTLWGRLKLLFIWQMLEPWPDKLSRWDSIRLDQAWSLLWGGLSVFLPVLLLYG